MFGGNFEIHKCLRYQRIHRDGGGMQDPGQVRYFLRVERVSGLLGNGVVSAGLNWLPCDSFAT